MITLRDVLLSFAVLAGNRVVAGDAATAKLAVYSVPVLPELAAFASFNVNDVTVSDGIDGLNIAYSLPSDLVGPGESPIQLKQRDASETTGFHDMVAVQNAGGVPREVGEASCKRHPFAEAKIQCMIVYDSLRIDSDKVAAYLQAQREGEEEEEGVWLSKRLKVAAAFANEPSGLLSIETE